MRGCSAIVKILHPLSLHCFCIFRMIIGQHTDILDHALFGIGCAVLILVKGAGFPQDQGPGGHIKCSFGIFDRVQECGVDFTPIFIAGIAAVGKISFVECMAAFVYDEGSFFVGSQRNKSLITFDTLA